MHRRTVFRYCGLSLLYGLFYGKRIHAFENLPESIDSIPIEIFRQLPEHATEIGALFLPGGFQKQKETCSVGETVLF